MTTVHEVNFDGLLSFPDQTKQSKFSMSSSTKALKYLDPVVVSRLDNMEMRARLIVEGFITGMHKSPYHGFSVEFAEHRPYNTGDELRHVDWKVFGKTDRHYVKQYEEENKSEAPCGPRHVLFHDVQGVRSGFKA